jgi:hypothetical protein
MNVARRRWSPDEKAMVRKMLADGYTYKQIGERLRPGVPTAWRSIGEIVREERAAPAPSGTAAVKQTPRESMGIVGPKVSLDDLPDSLQDSLTAREMLGMLDQEQTDIFLSTYEDLLGESDEEQVTRAEREMLLRAAYAHVKYLRSQRMVATCENYLMMDLDGQLDDSDEDKKKKRLAGRGDAYKKEAEIYHKEYMELLDSLKLTRRQRLDKIKDTRNTLLDLQQDLTRKARQESIVEEIKKINTATREEFERMAKGEVGPDGQVHPWLIGAFDEVTPPKEDNKNA